MLRLMWLILLALVRPAAAQVDAGLCKTGFDAADWAVRLGSVEDAFAGAEIETARGLLDNTRAQARCLERVIEPALLARTAHALSILAFFDQDETGVVRWARLALEADPNADWPAFLPETHPLREQEVDETELVGPMDLVLVPPAGGSVWLNGRRLDKPRARSEVPGLLQVVDGDDRVVDTAWIDGGAFPEQWLGEPGSVAVAPAPAPKEPKEPKEKKSGGPSVGRLIAGGAIAAASGTLYAVGAAMQPGLDRAGTEAELAGARSRINLMVMGSGALAAGAVGLSASAFVSTEGAGLRLSTRF